ncbi:hypothetical protein L1887_24031 [Cichorium endivia]|nr:hypothetical protein L1887_24031 [Cichorium endivia]
MRVLWRILDNKSRGVLKMIDEQKGALESLICVFNIANKLVICILGCYYPSPPLVEREEMMRQPSSVLLSSQHI